MADDELTRSEGWTGAANALVGPAGVIDLTDRRDLKAGEGDGYNYEEGHGAMFRTGYDRPSRRAAAIIELVKSRR